MDNNDLWCCHANDATIALHPTVILIPTHPLLISTVKYHLVKFEHFTILAKIYSCKKSLERTTEDIMDYELGGNGTFLIPLVNFVLH